MVPPPWLEQGRHGGGGVAKKRVTLGKTSQLTPDQARKAAADMLAAVQLGGDPAQDKAERRASVTVGELIDFFDARYVAPMLKPGTAIGYRIALEELRRAHGTLKATSLMRSQVATLHFAMANRPTPPIVPSPYGRRLLRGRLSRAWYPRDRTPRRTSRNIASDGENVL